MSSCSVVINGRSVEANFGETLIDAGLSGWVAIPHDCCSGQCESCRVEVVSGSVEDHGTRDGRTVLACQATVSGPATIRFEELEDAIKRSGVVTGIRPLSPEIFEVVVTLTSPLAYRPGQYVSLKFSGYPARDYSPTLRLVGETPENELIFHIKRFPGGIVSSQIGATIGFGHRVQVKGPYGYAYLREGTGPLVLVAGGTGWAPIWTIARAARKSQRHRHLVVIAGVRHRANLYMRDAMDWLQDDGVRDLFLTCSRDPDGSMLPGRPSHYLPAVGPEDTVYVAGTEGLVTTVKTKARAAAARCYADPFLPGAEQLTLVDRVMQMLQRPGAAAIPPDTAGTSKPTGSLLSRLGGRRIEPQPAASAIRRAVEARPGTRQRV